MNDCIVFPKQSQTSGTLAMRTYEVTHKIQNSYSRVAWAIGEIILSGNDFVWVGAMQVNLRGFSPSRMCGN